MPISHLRDPDFIAGTYLDDLALQGAPMWWDQASKAGLSPEAQQYHWGLVRVAGGYDDNIRVHCWSCDAQVAKVRFIDREWTVVPRQSSNDSGAPKFPTYFPAKKKLPKPDQKPTDKIQLSCRRCGADQIPLKYIRLMEMAWGALLRHALDDPWFRDIWMRGLADDDFAYDNLPVDQKVQLRLPKP